MSTGDAAEILGVSRQHVVDLCDRGDLPCTRLGTHRRVHRADLERLIKPPLTREQEKSLWLHRAVLGALVLDPEGVLETAQRNVDEFQRAHRRDGMAVRYLEQWRRSISDGVDAVARVLVGTDECSSEMRQNSPFAGVLSEEQRMKVLRSFREHWSSTHEHDAAMA